MGKPIRARRGYLTPVQVAKRARKLGFVIDPAKLSRKAHAGDIPFAMPIPGMRRGIMFSTAKLDAVIEAAPKRAVVPEGSVTEYGLQKLALSQNLKLYSTTIRQTIARIEAGEEPPAPGLARDLSHPKRPYIIPAELAERILRRARIRKRVKLLVKKEKLIPIAKLADALDMSKGALLKSPYLRKIMVQGRAYVTPKEADSFFYWKIERAKRKLGKSLLQRAF